jgi:hypothetical protein
MGKANGDYFGYRVTMSDDGNAMTAIGYSPCFDPGYVRVFQREGNQWKQPGCL